MRGPLPHVRLIVLSLIALSISGCVDEGSAKVQEPDDDGGFVVVDPDTGTQSVVYWSPAEFDIEDPYYHAGSEDGTFEIQQHHHPGAMSMRMAGVDPGTMQGHDITDKIPKDVPVRLSAEIHADIEQGDVDMWFNVPQNEIWTAMFDAPRGGYTRGEIILLHTSDDPIEVVVFYDEAEPAQTFDYVITYEVRAAKEMLYAGVPVAIDVPRAARSIEVEWNGTEGGAVWLWAPDDTFIGRFESNDPTFNHTLPSGAPRGEYVLLLAQGSDDAWVTLYVEGEAPDAPFSMRPLKQEIQQVAPHAIHANTAAEYRFTSEKVPLQVAVQVGISDVTKDAHFTLSSPEAELITSDITGELPFYSVPNVSGTGFFWITPLGTHGLSAGEYTATFQGDPNGHGQMTAFLVYPIR